MCDTLGKIINENVAFFGKNSDRQTNEPQVIVYIPEKSHTKKKLKTTYLEIEQVKNTHAVLISKPCWIWGAEMGVNDCGVCIGNEAVHTIGNYSKSGLIGMDLVRLGLERGNTAKDSLHIIIDLLEKYGQGGNCGYEKEELYDNSFIIMDACELYVLETKDKKWAYSKLDCKNISNQLSLNDAQYFNETPNFKNKFAKQHKGVNNAQNREKIIKNNLKNIKTEKDVFKILRNHYHGLLSKENRDVSSPCMHGKEYRTTASMVVRLEKDQRPVVWFTGCSHPCLSLFKPWSFGDSPAYPILTENETDLSYWTCMEETHKKLSKKPLRKFKHERDKIEGIFTEKLNTDNFCIQDCLEIEESFFAKWTH